MVASRSPTDRGSLGFVRGTGSRRPAGSSRECASWRHGGAVGHNNRAPRGLRRESPGRPGGNERDAYAARSGRTGTISDSNTNCRAAIEPGLASIISNRRARSHGAVLGGGGNGRRDTSTRLDTEIRSDGCGSCTEKNITVLS